jgi:hypothetical protein
MFDFFEDHPERMSRFKDGMSFLSTFPGLEPSYTVKAYDWASLGKATVVDVGGSHGLVSIALAKEFPDLHSWYRTFQRLLKTRRLNCQPKRQTA